MILAINTAFLNANLGIIVDKNVRFEETIDAKSKHSENVLKTIDFLCKKADVDINNIENLALVVGPGSFTGIRIGVALAKGFGCANERLKVFPLSSLDLMAYIYLQKHKEKIVCVLNALSNLLFVCEYDENGRKLGTERMINKSDLSFLNGKIVCLKGDIVLDNAEYIEIDTSSFLAFSEFAVKNLEPVSSDKVEPCYLRPSQAEENSKKSD